MSFSSQQSTRSTRSLDRALRVVALIIVLLTGVLLMRVPTNSMNADNGESIPTQARRNPHPDVFRAVAVESVDDLPQVEAAIPAVPEPPVKRAASLPIKVVASPLNSDPPAPIADREIAVAAVTQAEPELSALPEEIAVEVQDSVIPAVAGDSWPAYEEFPPTSPANQPEVEQPAVIAATSTEASRESLARFQRLDRHGDPATDGKPWSCVRDNRHGLVWEVKTSGGGLRDAMHVYTWFDPLRQEAAGIRDGGRCAGGIDCDTHGYQDAINRLELCGLKDWRLPARQELQTLVEVDSERNTAAIDSDYFPLGLASWYWSASANENRPDYAWYLLFRNGLPLNDLKSRPKHIRLVRGERLVVASSR